MKNKLQGIVIGIIFSHAILMTFSVVASAITKTITVTLNKVNLTVNGKPIMMDNFLYNDSTYVPMRAVAELLGKEVGWDATTNTASINDKRFTGPTPTPTPFTALNLQLIQDGTVFNIKNQNQEISLERHIFSIRFNMQRYGYVKISALENEKLSDMTKTGVREDSVLYFSGGHSMANDGQYSSMIINNEANNYITYRNDSDTSNVRIANDVLDIDWEIDGIGTFDNSKYSLTNYSIRDFPLKKIYLVVYVDFNGDKIINSSEYYKIILSFKDISPS